MNYYSVSRKASQEIGNHEGLIYLRRICQQSQKILDVGCGEGTRLNTLVFPKKNGWGVDPNEYAIRQASKKYPYFHFRRSSGEGLPFREGMFDLTYSAFSIEHCQDPEKFIKEMIRVTKIHGRIVLLAPNYGSPNRRSPVSCEDKFSKLVQGTIKDFFPQNGLDWIGVTPKDSYKNIDDDTTFEPYILSAIRHLKNNHLRVEKYSSLWSIEPDNRSMTKKLISVMGKINIFPFQYWGPQMFISAIK